MDRLRLLGLQVDDCAGGQGALERTQEELHQGRTYDVLVIDWRMDGLDGIETLKALRQLIGDGTPASILVTAFDEPAMWAQARSVSYDAVLIKPITASALHDTLVRVVRRQGAAVAPDAPALEDVEARLLREHAGQRVLLAEDNPINQEVALELLRRVGLEVETADDGMRAVDMALSRPYDLVLMDVQMPLQDGYAATRSIREKMGRKLPIIAMTANAFVEDRNACLAAGMNDHLAKPVDPGIMYAMLVRWLPLKSAQDVQAQERAAALPTAGARQELTLMQRLSAVDGLDAQRALEGVGGQPAALERILRRFVNIYRHGEPSLATAQGERDGARLAAVCHSLRGACAAVGAVHLQGQLLELEQSLKAGAPPAQALDTVQHINAELMQFVTRIAGEMDR